MGTDFLIGKILIGGSVFLNVDSFKKNIRFQGLDMVIPSLVPNPKTSDLSIVKDFRTFAQNNHIEDEPVALQTYISARIFVEIIKKIKGPVTKQKIIEVAEQFKGFDLGGIPLTFDPQTRRLINTLWIDSGKEQWQEESIEGTTKTPLKDSTVKEPESLQEKQATEQVPMHYEKIDREQKSDVQSGIISIGSSMDLSRSGKLSSEEINRTIDLVFDRANKAHKLSGLTLHWQVLDDQYDPAKARDNIEKLLKDKIDIVLMPYGAELFLSYRDLIKDGKILALFPFPGITGKRSPDLTYCINFRPSYEDEATVLANYIVEHYHPRKVAIFYQDDAFGKIPFEAAKKIFENHSIVCTPVPYMRNDANITEQIDSIIAARPDCIGLLATPMAALGLLKQLQDPGIREKQFFLDSGLGQSAMKKYLKDNKLKYIASSVVPNPQTSMLPIVQRLSQGIREYIYPH